MSRSAGAMIVAASALLAGCGPSPERSTSEQRTAVARPAASAPITAPAQVAGAGNGGGGGGLANSTERPLATALPPVAPPEPGRPGGLADDRRPLPERQVSEPSSPAAAGVVAQRYLAALESRRFGVARQLEQGLPSPLRSEAEQASNFHSQIGQPFAEEGAAGSSYISVPVLTYGRTGRGQPFVHRWTLVLRRVNDVPGASARQLVWHLSAIHVAQPGEWPGALEPEPPPPARR